ncbi:hypothetical protein O0L34_g6472 [Tuta absoluta]|nr:hypothetical protein O0L34_g6472 [Tuta absoluta]
MASPVVQNEIPTVETAARAMGKSCENGIFSATCLKIEALSMLEKLNAKDEVQLLPGVSLTKDSSKDNEGKADEFAVELARSLPSNPDERLDKYLLYRFGSYLNTHSVTLKLLDDNAAEGARALIGEARGKGDILGGGKKGGMGGLLALAALYKGTLLSMAMGGVALLAGKALTAALMSLVLSAVIGLKSLTSHKGSSTVEVYAKPHDEGWSGHSAYRRQINVRRR